MDLVKISKYIALLLRHKPEMGGLEIDHAGWCDTQCLVNAVSKKFPLFNMDILEEVVATNNKKRYIFNEERTKIRASQGHSIDVDVELKKLMPPDILYHGSAQKYDSSIRQQGIIKGNRLYVHLSKDIETAISVGKRHGALIVYEINSRQMAEDGFIFYLSENGVWLTEHVPVKYIKPLCDTE